MTDLTSIANLRGTDKGTQSGAAHGYSLVYDMLLAPMRSRERVDILEMGLAIGGPELGGDINREITGSPSIDTWLAYFDNAQIVGFDISDFSKIRHERFHFVRGDSGKRSDVEQILALGRRFDVIIDDASHASYHQQLGLAVLFDTLKPGGLYIVEDLSWQPTDMERDLPSVPRTAQLLAEFSATAKFPVSKAINEDAARQLEQSIASICYFEESLLNTLADSYNRRFGLPRVSRADWRGKGAAARLLDPYFWLYNWRRFQQSLTGSEFTTHQSVKVAVIQKIARQA